MASHILVLENINPIGTQDDCTPNKMKRTISCQIKEFQASTTAITVGGARSKINIASCQMFSRPTSVSAPDTLALYYYRRTSIISTRIYLHELMRTHSRCFKKNLSTVYKLLVSTAKKTTILRLIK